MKNGYTFLGDINPINPKPHEWGKWHDKIGFPPEVKQMLQRLSIEVRIVYKGISTVPERDIFCSKTGEWIGKLDWFLQIFETKHFIKKAREVIDERDQEEAIILKLGKLIHLVGDQVIKNRKVAGVNAIYLEKFLLKIQTIEENLMLYSGAYESIKEGPTKKAVEHMLKQGKKLTGIILENPVELMKNFDGMIGPILFKKNIPIWILNFFSKKAILEDNNYDKLGEKPRLKKTSRPESYFYPSSYSGGPYFTCEEILSNDMMIVNDLMIAGNKNFIHSVREVLRHGIQIGNSDSRLTKDYMKSITDTRWNMRQPEDDVLQRIKGVIEGKNIKSLTIKPPMGRDYEQSKIGQMSNFLKILNHQYNVMMRMQIADADPVDNFWEDLFDIREWGNGELGAGGQLLPMYEIDRMIEKDEGRVREILERFISLEGDSLETAKRYLFHKLSKSIGGHEMANIVKTTFSMKRGLENDIDNTKMESKLRGTPSWDNNARVIMALKTSGVNFVLDEFIIPRRGRFQINNVHLSDNGGRELINAIKEKQSECFYELALLWSQKKESEKATVVARMTEVIPEEKEMEKARFFFNKTKSKGKIYKQRTKMERFLGSSGLYLPPGDINKYNDIFDTTAIKEWRIDDMVYEWLESFGKHKRMKEIALDYMDHFVKELKRDEELKKFGMIPEVFGLGNRLNEPEYEEGGIHKNYESDEDYITYEQQLEWDLEYLTTEVEQY